jgi:MFS family permease
MFGARALATLLCTLPAAALADRFGRKCAILPGLATEAAAMLVMAAARELP